MKLAGSLTNFWQHWQKSSSVFLVWHSSDPEDDDTAELLGVFWSRSLASERVVRAEGVSGFAAYPDGFVIDECPVDVDQWVEGFVEIDPDEWVAGGWQAVIRDYKAMIWIGDAPGERVTIRAASQAKAKALLRAECGGDATISL